MSEKKKGNKLIKHIIFIIISLLIGYVVSIATESNMQFDSTSIGAALSSSTSYIVAAVAYIVCLLADVLTKPRGDNDQRSSGTGKTKEGEDIDEFADSRWVTEKELRTEAAFRFVKFSQLSTFKKDGIVVRAEAEANKKDILINMYKPIHTLVVGTTGSGKTEGFVFPTINIWTKCASKPSIFVSDPKGELFGKTSNAAKKNGYRVVCIDLRHPYSSVRWNPLSKAYDLFQRSLHLEKEVKKFVGGQPNPSEYKLMKENYGNEWYAFNGVAYPTEAYLKQDLLATKSELKMEAERELTEIAMALRPIENQHDPSWEKGAQAFIEGFLNAMLEESEFPEQTGMNRDKFCLYNLAQITSYKDVGEDNYVTLKNYAQGRSRDSKVMPLVSTALFNAAGTTKSYMGFVTESMKLFQDMGINYLTSKNELDLTRFAYDPTIVYFIVPDEDKTRHGLATIFISQLYKQLIAEAVKCNPSDPSLPKNVYFLLDEFANIPKIPNFDSLITVGRSRKIFFCIVVQSFTQLDGLYGEKEANTIRDNCNIKIFIGTDDQKTKEAFSKYCGDISLEIKSKSKSTDSKGQDGGSNTSAQTKQRPLIYPDELGRLPPETCVVKIFREFPIKATFTYRYKLPNLYDCTDAPEPYSPKQYFDTDKYYYDFKRVANNRSNSSISDLF